MPMPVPAFILQLRKAIAGYAAQLAPRDEVVLLGLDSATPGPYGHHLLP